MNADISQAPLTTTQEKVGDVLLGTHLMRCRHGTRFDARGKLRLVRSPLWVTSHGRCVTKWDEEQTRPGGWKRTVEHELDYSAHDPSRATARFEVVQVRKVPGSTGRDAGYGGGTEVIVRRLDGKRERIVYTRKCSYTSDVDVPVTLVTP